jgi:hypothetical protein
MPISGSSWAFQSDFIDFGFLFDMLKVIAATVTSDPETYSEAFLGKANAEYCRWILHPDKWGGLFKPFSFWLELKPWDPEFNKDSTDGLRRARILYIFRRDDIVRWICNHPRSDRARYLVGLLRARNCSL